MEGIVKIRSAFKSPNDQSMLYTHMPQNDLGRDTSKYRSAPKVEFKSDPSNFRSKWLDRLEQSQHWAYSMFLPSGCPLCTITRYVILALAIIGIVSIIH